MLSFPKKAAVTCPTLSLTPELAVMILMGLFQLKMFSDSIRVQVLEPFLGPEELSLPEALSPTQLSHVQALLPQKTTQ